VRERLEPYKYPREVVFLDALPRTHLGKVDRAALRR
jgi:acyl-coenzyme A synthetase/AMP-(fatty) acid ligase